MENDTGQQSESISQNPESKPLENRVKVKINPWMISTFLLGFLILLATGYLFFKSRNVIQPRYPVLPSVQPTVTSIKSPSTAPDAVVIKTVEGEIVCLPHRNKSGPQTLECAMGLMDSEDNYYGLEIEQPDLMPSLSESGKKVIVTGEMKEASSSKYDISATIKVLSVEFP